ncbi:hypothetical protein [Paracoccus shandongensis]|uniref:hypothetical protein n=1 Tax=Paracoccus shandongensis TaxID=2816048 RepID=UPI001A8FDF1C|nr:hypothetical protein [Paracoccus shandongensis]
MLARFARTSIDLDAPAGTLPLAAQQLVVLARAVARDPRVLILTDLTLTILRSGALTGALSRGLEIHPLIVTLETGMIVLVLTRSNTLLIGLGVQPASVQAAPGANGISA